jgi:hypothetical protein
MSRTTSPRYVVGAGIAWLAAAVIVLCIGLALVLREPPRVIKESAPPDWFSAERAMVHVEAIAKEPHPWGSPAQEPVREYIRTMLERYQVTPEDHVTPPPANFSGRGPVQNIAGRLPGSDPTKAVLLMAHYDSRREGPGAADDSAGVATLLETLRALKVGPQLKNDVIFLFTDAEEVCLCGARAFVDNHPWKDDVAVVLNFDGRGAGGPVYLSDSGSDNGWLIEQFAAVAPFPRGNSLMGDVQKLMPNDSDLTPFREAGYSVMNFNWIDDYGRYHRATDIPSALDRGTLQHLGEYALPLTRHFGNIDLGDTKAPNATYFNLLGNVFVFYPQWGSYIALIVLILLFVGAVYLGRRHGHASIGQSLIGFLVFLVGGALAAGASYGLIQVLELLHGDDLRWVQNVYLGFFAALSIFIMAVIIAAARLWLRAQDLMLGALFTWVIAAIAIAFVAPGGLPFFTWPAIAMLVALAIHFSVDDFEAVGTTSGAIFAIAALPALFMFTPAIIAFNQAMRLQLVYVTVVFVVLLAGVLMPLLCTLLARRFWPLPAVALFTANVFLIWGLAMAEPMAKWANAEAQTYLEMHASPPAEAVEEAEPAEPADQTEEIPTEPEPAAEFPVEPTPEPMTEPDTGGVPDEPAPAEEPAQETPMPEVVAPPAVTEEPAQEAPMPEATDQPEAGEPNEPEAETPSTPDPAPEAAEPEMTVEEEPASEPDGASDAAPEAPVPAPVEDESVEAAPDEEALDTEPADESRGVVDDDE